MSKKKNREAEKETVNPEQTVQEQPDMTEQAAPAESAAENTENREQVQPTAEEALRAELDEARKNADTYLNMAQRVQADFENYRRRNQNSMRESFDDGASAFATTLLPVIDNLERAIAAAAESPDPSLKSGVEMIQRQLVEAFEKRGITAIERLGQPFDPNLENAIMQGTPEDGEPGTVCQVFQKGYQMKDKLLRAAMVKVVPD